MSKISHGNYKMTCAKMKSTAVHLATYYMYKNATEDPAASSNGLIVCTASNAGLYPFPVAPLYASTKSGVIGLVRSLARRLEQDKIRINALAPAVIGTLVPELSK